MNKYSNQIQSIIQQSNFDYVELFLLGLSEKFNIPKQDLLMFFNNFKKSKSSIVIKQCKYISPRTKKQCLSNPKQDDFYCQRHLKYKKETKIEPIEQDILIFDTTENENKKNNDLLEEDWEEDEMDDEVDEYNEMSDIE